MATAAVGIPPASGTVTASAEKFIGSGGGGTVSVSGTVTGTASGAEFSLCFSSVSMAGAEGLRSSACPSLD